MNDHSQRLDPSSARRDGAVAEHAGLADPSPPRDFSTWMPWIQQRIEALLDDALPASDLEPARLHEAMRYAVLGGGKRVRPLLAYAAAEVTGASLSRVDRVAVAVELIHAYSLVHDDLPCMDDDVLRRGRPTCHIQFDEATAMLAGDALQSEATLSIVEEPLSDDPQRNASLLRLFALACGSRGMAGGQAIDLVSVGRALTLPELEQMHRLKTGALIEASILLGAGCGVAMSATEDAAIRRFADAMGLAFQVVDDILDVEGSSPQLGKTPGKDALQNKPTYVSVMGLPAAKACAKSLRDEAIAALQPFAARAGRLAAMADFILLRKN